MARKTRSASSRRPGTSRKSTKSLKTRRRFSVFQLIIVAAVVAIAAIIGISKSGGDTPKALVLNSNAPPIINVDQPYATAGAPNLSGHSSFSPPVSNSGTFTIKGSGLPPSATADFGGDKSSAASSTNSGGTQSMTFDIPRQATASGGLGAGANRQNCGAAVCNLDLNVTDQSGNPLSSSSISSVKFNPPPPAITNVEVNGQTAVFTGTGLTANTRFTLGKYSFVANVVDNGDGTQSAYVPLVTGKCWYSSIPLVNNLCNKVDAGQATAQATTSDGMKSNTGSFTLTRTSDKGGSTNFFPPGYGPHTGKDCGDSSDGSGLQPGCGTPGGSGGCPPVAQQKDPSDPTGKRVLNGGGFCIGAGAAICPKTDGNVTVLKPNGGETWNYNTDTLTFSWLNGKKSVVPPTPNPTGDSHSGALAQVTLCGQKGWYFIAQCGDKGMTQGESCPYGGKHEYTNKMLCFGVLASGGRFNDPNVGTPGATLSFDQKSCVFGAPPNGQYKAYVQVFGLTEPQMCLHLQGGAKRCTGLPAKIGQGASDLSDNWFTITGSKYVDPGS